MVDSSIAIIGADLDGLVLARVLQAHGVGAVVYELDPAPDAPREMVAFFSGLGPAPAGPY